MNDKKIVLAYSGGLDTSVCLRWLREKGYKVITFTANLGQAVDFNLIRKKALKAGAENVYIEDLRDEFARDFVLPSLKAGAIYQSKYLLSTALGRPLIAKELINIAKKEKAKIIVHGCSAKGNDQVRFEISIRCLAPELKIFAPLRIWELTTREKEIEYAKKYKIPVDVKKRNPYSIDKNLWGVSIECGKLEKPESEPPEDSFQITTSPEDSPNKPRYIEITFEKGSPNKINGKKFSLIRLIELLNKIGAKYAIGRQDLIEDRVVGIKTREIYEAPAANILYTSHKELEQFNLDKQVLDFKQVVSLKYAQLIYEGLWYTPLRYALDEFINFTQKNITGCVRLKLYKGNCIVVGRSSPYSLYKKELATYGKEDIFDRSLAEGFIKIFGLPFVRE